MDESRFSQKNGIDPNLALRFEARPISNLLDRNPEAKKNFFAIFSKSDTLIYHTLGEIGVGSSVDRVKITGIDKEKYPGEFNYYERGHIIETPESHVINSVALKLKECTDALNAFLSYEQTPTPAPREEFPELAKFLEAARSFNLRQCQERVHRSLALLKETKNFFDRNGLDFKNWLIQNKRDILINIGALELMMKTPGSLLTFHGDSQLRLYTLRKQAEMCLNNPSLAPNSSMLSVEKVIDTITSGLVDNIFT